MTALTIRQRGIALTGWLIGLSVVLFLSLVALVVAIRLQQIAIWLALYVTLLGTAVWRPRYGLYGLMFAAMTLEPKRDDPLTEMGWLFFANFSMSTPLDFVIFSPAELLAAWRDDPWAYCLVLSPDPPFKTRYRGFETSVVVTPPEVESGGAVTLTVFITAQRTSTLLVDVEVRDEHGAQVAQWIWDEQPLPSRERVVYTTRWKIPRDTATGLYVVKVGLFGPGWGRLRHWNDGTAILFVQPPVASTP